MELFQILDCSSTLANCCSDYSMVTVLEITRRIFGLIQLIVPIVLVVGSTIQFVQLTINPELKDGFRRILNKLMAALIVFLIPTLVDIVLSTVSSDISVAACWQQAKNKSLEIGFNKGNYVAIDSDDDKVWYEAMKEKIVIQKNSNSSKKSSTASDKQKEVVNYAKKFVGKPYQLGGYWNGEEPYKATDCCGFIVGVYKHFGVSLPTPCKNMIQGNSNVEIISENELQAGDIIAYAPSGGYWHYAIYTGNGNQIVHASNKKDGVKLSDNYKYRSVKTYIRVKNIK